MENFAFMDDTRSLGFYDEHGRFRYYSITYLYDEVEGESSYEEDGEESVKRRYSFSGDGGDLLPGGGEDGVPPPAPPSLAVAVAKVRVHSSPSM